MRIWDVCFVLREFDSEITIYEHVYSMNYFLVYEVSNLFER